MDAALIGAIASGLAVIITPVLGFVLNRQRKTSVDIGELEDEVYDLRAQFEAALRHIWLLREEMARHGHAPPDMPDELTTRRRRHTG